MEQRAEQQDHFTFRNPKPDEVKRVLGGIQSKDISIQYDEQRRYNNTSGFTLIFAGNIRRVSRYAEDLLDDMLEHASNRDKETNVRIRIGKR